MSSLVQVNMKDFNKKLKGILDSIEDGGLDVYKKVVFDLDANLKKRTPRETGRARSGWHIEVGKSSEWVPPEGRKSYSPKAINPLEITLDRAVHETNNVEYIVPLDNGHSRRAASGIVNFSLAKTKITLEKLAAVESKRKIKL